MSTHPTAISSRIRPSSTDGWIGFAEVELDLAWWIAARAFTTGEGPRALFDAAVAELRARPVLMPGVHRLARLVAREREKATTRLWDTLHGLLDDEQRRVLATLVEVPAAPRLDRALQRVPEIAALAWAGWMCR